MKFKEKYEKYVDMLEEGMMKNFGLGLVASLAMMGSDVKAGTNDIRSPKITQIAQNREDILLRMARRDIGKHEGSKNYIYDDKHPNVKWQKGMKVDGNLTIGVGHLVKDNEIDKYINGIDNDEIQKLFNRDIQHHIKVAKRLFPKYSSYPPYLQVALLSAVYRGEMESWHNTVKLINQGKWKEASEEYIDRGDYRASKSQGDRHGVWKRMDKNAERMKHFGRDK